MRVTGRWIAGIAAVLATAGAACGDGENCVLTEPLCDVETVTMEPSSAVITTVGGTVQLTLVARDAANGVLNVTGIPVTWNSSNTAVATVNASGLVTGLSAGSSTITASSELFPGETRTASVTVDLSAVATQLGISTQPGGAVSGSALTPQPVVQIRNAGGALISSTAAVTASLASGGGTLTGTTTVNAVGGVATFTNLVVTGTAGARTLQFTSSGLTSATSSSFTVTAPPVGGPTPWFVEDFSSYTNTADLTTTGGGRPFTSFYSEDGGSYTLDNTGVNVNGLSLTKSLRVNFPSSATWTDDSRVVNGTADRCDNYTMRPVIQPNGSQFGTQRRLWFEFYIRFSSNWTTVPTGAWGCAGAPDHKTWLMEPQGGSGRWEIKIGFGSGGLGPAVTVGDPVFGQTQFPNLKSWVNNDPEAVAPTYWNNQWHRVRVEVFLGSTPGASDGVFRVWMNNTQIHNRTGITYNSAITGFSSMQMGANRNHGQSEAMSFSWGLIRIFNTNPGW
jgi:hypothetical protein